MADEPKPLSRRLRSLALKCVIVGITTGLCLLLAEFGARILFPQFNPSAQLSFQVMPGHFALGPKSQTEWDIAPKGDFKVPVKFNQYGFRDVKDLRTATNTDWFVVGDSFSLGFGVDEEKRYSNLLEQKLQTGGSAARVFNIAIPGNFLDYQRLVKYAQDCSAHIQHLIVGVCMDNDLEDYRTGKSDWELMPQWDANGSFMDHVRKWFKARSALYLTASFVLQSSPAMRKFLEKTGFARDLVALDAGHHTDVNEPVLKSGCDELVKLAAQVPDCLVLIVPSRRLWLGDQQAELQLNATFVKMCRDAGLKVVDLQPVFEQDAQRLNCYFAHDPHWSPRGHVVAADELCKAIQANGQKP